MYTSYHYPYIKWTLILKCHVQLIYLNADQRRIFPRKLRINKGWRAEFECISSNDVVWFLYSSETAVFYGSSLIILSVKLEDQGYYECKGTSEDGGIFRAISKLEVNGTCSGRNHVNNSS